MDMRQSERADVVQPMRRAEPGRDGALASLAGSPLTGRFCAWQGLSGRRYVTTVYPVELTRDHCGLPDYEAFVLIAVWRGATGRKIVDVTTVERASERRAAIAVGLARGAGEWHVHFLADDRRARAAMIDDLRARHIDLGERPARCA